jgi:hypothetical protein
MRKMHYIATGKVKKLPPTYCTNPYKKHKRKVKIERGLLLCPKCLKVWKEAEITKLLKTPEGKQQLAESMAAPIRQRLDYAGVARRAMVVEPLPERITVPEFEITSTPVISLPELRTRRFRTLAEDAADSVLNHILKF